MTDAAIPVTEEAIEDFTESYLAALGADVHKDGRRWTVSLPTDATTNLKLDGAVLQITTDPDAVSDDTIAVAPESSFVERMLDEAAEWTPHGSVSLTAEDWELRLPSWITAGPVEITDQAFTPYYDRRGLCVLFHVGIETVSEYQQEVLHAVAVDLNDHENRPRLAATYLELTETDAPQTISAGTRGDERTVTDALDSARTVVEDEIRPTVQDIRERATRAAEVELDEYRQFVHQRREELEDEINQHTDRIDEVNETIDTATEQTERVEALRKRKELRSELEDLRSELDELTTQIETEFAEKRSEIWERHALTVRIRPVSTTSIAYERGDLDLTLRTGDESTTVTYPYAVGSGVLDDPSCERCSQQLTEKNPLTLDGTQLIGSTCCGD